MVECLLQSYRSSPCDATLLPLLEDAKQRAYCACRPIVGQHSDAEDVAQEVILGFLEVLPTLTDAEHARRWIYRVALNKGLDQKRSRRRRVDREQRAAIERPQETDRTLQDDECEAVQVALAGIEPDLLRLIVGHFFEKRTLAELAAEIGISTTAIWKRLERAKDEVGRRLRQAGMAAAVPLLPGYLDAITPNGTADPISSQFLSEATQVLTGATQALSQASDALPQANEASPQANEVVEATSSAPGSATASAAASQGGWATTVGGIAMASKKGMALTAAVIGGLLLLSGILVVRERQRAVEAQRAAMIAHEEAMVRAERAHGDRSELQQRIDELEAELRRLRRVEATIGGDAAPEASIDGRLTEVKRWFDGQVERVNAERAALERDGQSTSAFIQQFEAEARNATAGLRQQIEANPREFFEFLDRLPPEDVDFVEFLVNALVDRAPIGSWLPTKHDYGAAPNGGGGEQGEHR